jgi:hypothetical protein
MRRVLSLGLVLLLVLRGLLGDAMAMGVMPVPAVPQAQSQQEHHGHHAVVDSAATHCGDTTAAAQGSHADHPAGCSACGICHSAFSAVHGALPHLPPGDSALHPHGSAQFASAQAAQATKPPIS